MQGIILTQPGVTAEKAADYQMIFNSNWPSLQIAFESRVDLPYLATTTIKHGLGFFPLVMAWAIAGGQSVGRIFAPSGNLSGRQTDVDLKFDKNNIYLTNNGVDSPITYTISIKCYNIDITKEVDYTLPLMPLVKTPYDPSFGIKVVKSGKDIKSTDLRDFILHSRAQSPAVLNISTTKSSNVSPVNGSTVTNIHYTNPAGYVPWILGYASLDGGVKYSPIAPGAQQSGIQFIQYNNYSAIGSLGIAHKASLVVLRDPLVIANNRRVTYG